jgi:hypothetical protein
MAFPVDGRRLFLHPAHGQVGVSALGGHGPEASLAADELWPQCAPARVGLVVGTDDKAWRGSADLLLAHLAGDGRLATACFGEEHVPVPEARGGRWDCLVLLGEPDPRHARRLALETYCREGGALVALGSACRALPEWPTFAEAMLGGRDLGSGRERMRLEVEPAECLWDHPVLWGVGAFWADHDPHGQVLLARGAEILLWGFGGGVRKPLAWSWRPRRGRVFYSLLGRQDDFRQEDFLQLVSNAVRWAAAGSG